MHDNFYLIVNGYSCGGATVFAARGKRLCCPHPTIRSLIDILMVTKLALVWTEEHAESVLHCKRQFARSGQISEFAPPNAPPLHSAAGSGYLSSPPPSRGHWVYSDRVSHE